MEYRAKINAKGAVVIPSQLREKLNIRPGDVITLQDDQNGVHITTLNQSIKRAQALFRQHVPEGTSVVEEFVKSRRQDAFKEECETESPNRG